jgi:hypothetical protein
MRVKGVREERRTLEGFSERMVVGGTGGPCGRGGLHTHTGIQEGGYGVPRYGVWDTILPGFDSATIVARYVPCTGTGEFHL